MYWIFKNLKKIFVFLVVAITLDAYSERLPADLYINSNNLTINQITKKAHFTGKVVLCFDDIVLSTENLEITYKVVDGKKTIDQIIIASKLTAKRINGDYLLIADSANYLMENKELTLLGNVILQNNTKILKTDKLVYYTKLKKIENR